MNWLGKLKEKFLPAADPQAAALQALRDIHARFAVRPDGSILVYGDLYLCGNFRGSIPDFSNVEVEGSVYAGECELTSLKGMPKIVGEHFFCDDNKLTSLDGAPVKVGKIFDCSKNPVKDFSKAPESFGIFQADMGRFTSPAELAERLGWLLVRDATTLREPVTTMKALSFRKRAPAEFAQF
jgi:hypothetical protein